MTTTAFHQQRDTERWRRVWDTAIAPTRIAWRRFARKRQAARSIAYDHGMTILGLGLLSGASFYHSIFTGLLVTGFLVLLFEMKVGE